MTGTAGLERRSIRLEEKPLGFTRYEWECPSCGQKHAFRQGIQEEDGWPNKSELTCENPDCGQEQSASFRACTVTPLEQV